MAPHKKGTIHFILTLHEGPFESKVISLKSVKFDQSTSISCLFFYYGFKDLNNWKRDLRLTLEINSEADVGEWRQWYFWNEKSLSGVSSNIKFYSLFALPQPELYKRELVRQSSTESSSADTEKVGRLDFSLKYDHELETLIVKVRDHKFSNNTHLPKHGSWWLQKLRIYIGWEYPRHPGSFQRNNKGKLILDCNLLSMLE